MSARSLTDRYARVWSIVLRPAAVVCATGLLAAGAAADDSRGNAHSATIVVAARDSSAKARQSADFLCDGRGDQEQINQAVQMLPATGGRIVLSEGTYDIRKVPGTLGGVLIDRSDVVLAGQGSSTRLVLAANQDTNVVRIIGSGVGRITIRDLYVDANRAENFSGRGDPNVSHDRFEYCGIKAFYTHPGGPTGERNHNITVQNCHVVDAQRLGIMLEGANMNVIDNVLGNAGSDSVEILTGPGEIRGNTVEITGQTHVAIGSDRGNSILMTENIVRVKPGGRLDIGFRSWAESERHVITNNILTVEPGGHCTLAMDVRGSAAVVSGNVLQTHNTEQPLRLAVGDGNTLVTGNVLQNVVIEVDDKTDGNKPIIVNNNVMHNSRIEHRKGNLLTTVSER